MVALHFTHDFTISSVVDKVHAVMRTDRQLQSPSPPRPRLVNQDGAGCIRATAPFSASPNPLLPFLLPDLEPQDPKRQKAPTRFWNIISPTAAAHHMHIIRISNVGSLVYKACQLMSTPDRAESVP
jgi:hypothetical protein